MKIRKEQNYEEKDRRRVRRANPEQIRLQLKKWTKARSHKHTKEYALVSVALTHAQDATHSTYKNTQMKKEGVVVAQAAAL